MQGLLRNTPVSKNLVTKKYPTTLKFNMEEDDGDDSVSK